MRSYTSKFDCCCCCTAVVCPYDVQERETSGTFEEGRKRGIIWPHLFGDGNFVCIWLFNVSLNWFIYFQLQAMNDLTHSLSRKGRSADGAGNVFWSFSFNLRLSAWDNLAGQSFGLVHLQYFQIWAMGDLTLSFFSSGSHPLGACGQPRQKLELSWSTCPQIPCPKKCNEICHIF